MRVAAEELRPLDPAVVVLDRLLPLLLVGVAERALAVAHDEHAADAVVVRDLLQVLQVAVVLLLVLVELVDVLDGVDAVVLLGDLGELERVEFLDPFCPKNARCSDHWASEILKSGSALRAKAKLGAARAPVRTAERARNSRRETGFIGEAPVAGMGRHSRL